MFSGLLTGIATIWPTANEPKPVETEYQVSNKGADDKQFLPLGRTFLERASVGQFVESPLELARQSGLAT
jgi:hypothetical protein